MKLLLGLVIAFSLSYGFSIGIGFEKAKKIDPANLKTDTIPFERLPLGEFIDSSKLSFPKIPANKNKSSEIIWTDIKSGASFIITEDSGRPMRSPFKKIIIQQPDRSFCIITTLGDKIGMIYYSDSIPAYDISWILYQFTDPRLNSKTPNKRHIGAWINAPLK